MMRCGPFSSDATLDGSNLRRVAEDRIRKLPAALHPIFLRCKRVLTEDEWDRLSCVTSEQRCAALGMQLEGQHVNSIIAYLLSAAGASRDGSANRIAKSTAAVSVPVVHTKHDNSTIVQAHVQQQRPMSTQQLFSIRQQHGSLAPTEAGGASPALGASRSRGPTVHAMPSHHQQVIQRLPSGGAAQQSSLMHLATAPPVLRRAAAAVPHTQQRRGLSPRSPGATPRTSPTSSRRRGTTPPPQLQNVTFPSRNRSPVQSSGRTVASPSLLRAVSPIAPPRFPPNVANNHVAPVDSTQRALFASMPSNASSSSTLMLRQTSSGATQHEAASAVRHGDAQPHHGAVEAPLDAASPDASPMRRSHSQNMLQRRTSTTSPSRDDGRHRDYHRLVQAADARLHHQQDGTSNGVASTVHPSLAFVRSGATGAPGSSSSAWGHKDTPSHRLSPNRASRWLVDFRAKLHDVGLDDGAWARLGQDEQEEFFSFWRMSQLQSAMVRTAYPPSH